MGKTVASVCIAAVLAVFGRGISAYVDMSERMARVEVKVDQILDALHGHDAKK